MKSPRRETSWSTDEETLDDGALVLPIELIERVCKYIYDSDKGSEVNIWPVDRVTSQEMVREEPYTPPVGALESDCASYYVRGETYGVLRNGEVRQGPVRVRGFWTECAASEIFPHIRVANTRHRLRKFMCVDELGISEEPGQGRSMSKHFLSFRSRPPTSDQAAAVNHDLLVSAFRPSTLSENAHYTLCGHVFSRPRSFVYTPAGSGICRRLRTALQTRLTARLQLYEFLPLVSCWGYPSPSTYVWVTPNSRTNRLPIFTEYQDRGRRRIRRNAVVYNALPVQNLLARRNLDELSDHDNHNHFSSDSSVSSSSSSDEER